MSADAERSAAERALAPHPDVLLTELGDGTGVLLHLGTKLYYTLNATGVALWKALAQLGGATPARLGDALALRFEVAGPDAARDVDVLATELLAEGLVVERNR
jgi:hypothetical protein